MVSPTTRFLITYSLAGLLAAILLVGLFPGLADRGGTDPATLARSGPGSYAEAVARAAPAVVNIYVLEENAGTGQPRSDDPFFERYFGNQARPESPAPSSLGSGVIIASEGYILTNHHVIRDAPSIRVSLPDGRSTDARIVGTDPETDLSVLKIELPDLPTARFGISDRLRVGDVVLAIGNPYSVGQTVTLGIVSAINRGRLGLSTFENFIQTDAAINPGNSGGALINARGELIGINTAIFSRSGGSQGIGFAIPERIARTVLENIVQHGRMIRGWAGLEVQNLATALAEALGLEGNDGVIVSGVLRGGPAAVAGLIPGDVITAVDGQAIDDSRDLLERISAITPGNQVRLQGIRDLQDYDWTLSISERPSLRSLPL